MSLLIILSGCASRQSKSDISQPSQTASLEKGLLIGLWKIENTDELDFFQYKYVEIKENEICTSWSETEIKGFECNQYVPYIIDGDTLKLGTSASPFYRVKIIDNKLELETISKAVAQKKRPYVKIK